MLGGVLLGCDLAMPKPYKRTTGRTYRYTKKSAVPKTFKIGFLSTMDERCQVTRTLRANYATIVNDVGGSQEIGHIKAALIQRFVWVEATLQTIEHEMVTG